MTLQYAMFESGRSFFYETFLNNSRMKELARDHGEKRADTPMTHFTQGLPTPPRRLKPLSRVVTLSVSSFDRHKQRAARQSPERCHHTLHATWK